MQRLIALSFCCFTFATSFAPAQEKLPAGAALQIGVHRLRVSGPITDYIFTPDQRTLVVAYGESDPKKFNVVLFDVASGLERKRLNIHGARHLAMAVRKPLLALDTKNGVEVWDLAAEKRVQHWDYPKGAREASALAISPDGTLVVAATPTLLRWNVDTGAALPAFRPRSAEFPIRSLQFSLDGSKLATLESYPTSEPVRGFAESSGDFAANLFQGVNWYLAPVSTMVGPGTRLLHTTAWTIGSHWVFRASAPVVTILDAKTGSKLAEFSNSNGECGVSPDGAMIAYSTNDMLFGNFGYSSRTDIARFDRVWTHVGTVDRAGSMVFSPDSKQLLVDGNLLWDIAGCKVMHEFATPDSASVRFSQDGKLIAVVRSVDQTRGRNMYNRYFGSPIDIDSPMESNYVQVLDVATGKPKSYATGYAESVGDVAYSPDGLWLASYSGETLYLHDAKTGAELRRWVAHKSAIRLFAFSPDGKTLASSSNDADIRLWDPANGKERQRLILDSHPPTSFSFTSDSKSLIAVHGVGVVRRWDLTSGKHVDLGELPLSQDVLSTAVTSDHLAYLQMSPGSGNLHLKWTRLRGQKVLAAADTHQDIAQSSSGAMLAFSSDGKMLAGSVYVQTGEDKVTYAVRVWESATQREIVRFMIDDNPTRLLAISPDGRLLAHGAPLPQKPSEKVPGKLDITEVIRPSPTEGAIVLRDLANTQGGGTSDKTTRPIIGHLGQITCLAFSPDGKFLATGGSDQVVYIWRVEHFHPRPLLPDFKGDVADYWPKLADANPADAYRALAQLERKPKETIALLRKHLKPAARVDEKAVVQRLRELASANFAVRQQANHALERAGEDAVPYVRAALQKPANLEARRRLETLLDKLNRPMEIADHIRAYRCLILLERINNAESQQLLAELSQGAPEMWLTIEARETLRRVAK